ncbi:hypothetical protein NM688_g4431 [Phlebia brevispora]|uniref:Uncharacterized protein n=1 Tax=Phlebia brevispora TaxID=194682 RepID=A0ACC1T342_9APHY|nr:hypothetical protein NM688_g4431 [Phlebia brevispora]
MGPDLAVTPNSIPTLMIYEQIQHYLEKHIEVQRNAKKGNCRQLSDGGYQDNMCAFTGVVRELAWTRVRIEGPILSHGVISAMTCKDLTKLEPGYGATAGATVTTLLTPTQRCQLKNDPSLYFRTSSIMSKQDDCVPTEYPYLWNKGSGTPLKEFLAKYKPSMVQDDGSKPWIWVLKDAAPLSDEDVEEEAAQAEAKTILTEVAEKVEAIQNDSSIPVRSNKKKGTKSKKELREAIQAEATEKFKDISVRYKCVSGKWLIFAPSEKVDAIWSTLATSLIEGPLASTAAYSIKVATSPREETPNYQHVLCLYIPDVYDKEKVVEVMKVLLRQHGMNLMGVKSNLYTAIGLDSKHPSGIQSTVWKNSALMKDTEIKARELKDQYFADLQTSKAAASTEKATEKAATPKSETAAKGKLKKKKKVADDPFASDEEKRRLLQSPRYSLMRNRTKTISHGEN